MGRLTTHILDASKGLPGSDIKIELYRVEGEHTTLINTVYTNSDGRTDSPVLEGEDYVPGKYQLVFHTGTYMKKSGVELLEPAFLDDVVIRFGIAAGQEHYHVPLLISPYSYSTYRGS
ncbi:hydroxyisourate hydrolase [Oceanisphaera arctica]|uniref:5-hydroxyisourate hydrolase n=1 Tax=Oceanisphaera arctica TaxID=641510 RepID=A0A2P5TN95_9GAMM|nr:hydroxyisourate hydrolase [Oceanisphaera arctica]PPL17001.1 hydroxyisourate hydrolase [Oceanisphaera arctica]GHA07505.1 5-hydroxyisourate hydrolase [Oceanisphaera arctica]